MGDETLMKRAQRKDCMSNSWFEMACLEYKSIPEFFSIEPGELGCGRLTEKVERATFAIAADEA